jgi:excisionase family DNA binding protein
MTRDTATTETVLRAEPPELDELSQVAGRLDAILSRLQTACLVGPNGESIELPDAAFEALKVIIDALARGQTITVIPHNKDLTTQEAADLLHVSRPHLIKLLEAGQLPYHHVGTHRRIRTEDVLAYQERRDQTRKTALDELARTSEELPDGYR